MNKKLRIAMVQDNFLVGDINGNMKKIIERTLTAKDAGAQLVLFPELALVGYPPEDLLHRRHFLTQVAEAIKELESVLTGVDVVFGAPVMHGEKLFNAALWLRDGETIARYFKQRLPNYSVFDEVRYFCEGDSPVVVEIDGVRCGLSICEDVWKKQTVAETKKAGADILLVLNASPFHVEKYQERVEQLQSRSRENNLPILYLNMVGGQDELVFDGESIVMI